LTISASRCISPNGPDTVGPVAALEAIERLALVHGQQWHDRERDSADHQRLAELNPQALKKLIAADRSRVALGAWVGMIEPSGRCFAVTASH